VPLAACGNVPSSWRHRMRINGYDFHTKADPPSSEDLAKAWQPYIDTCIQACRPGALHVREQIPVDKGSYGYGVFWNAARDESSLSDAERAELFSGTRDAILSFGPSGLD